MEIRKLYELYQKYPVISTDSRCVKANSIFFALKGKKFDGNNFAESAIKNEAAYAVVDNPGLQKDNRLIVVEDTLNTLQELANYHRRKCGFRILAVTGSNGKTTTKELIRNIISKNYRVFATKGNLNNHIGVPLTLLSMTADTEIGIIEMGANHPGEIRHLCKIAEPDYGLITNIGKAHLEGFGSIEGVKKAKQELFIYLRENRGTILGNMNDANVNDIIPEDYSDVLKYGKMNTGCWAEYISSDPYLKFRLYLADEVNGLEIITNLFGRYNIENAVAAATFASLLDIDIDTIKQALENYIAENNRSQILRTKTNEIFLDAYNANPTSMKAAIADFIEVRAANKYLILGEMLEVGTGTDDEHSNVLKFIKDRNISNVICIGKAFRKPAEQFGYDFFNDVSDATEMIKSGIIKNAAVFMKGSRANQLEKLVQFL